MNTIEISNVYELIKKSKLTKMEDKDKFLVIKAIRVLKPICTDYQDFVKDAQEKLKDDKYESNLEEYQKIQREHPQFKLSELTPDEISKIETLTKYFNNFNKSLEECLNTEAKKEHELAYEKLSDEAFTKFISSNDFSVEEILNLEDTLKQVESKSNN